MKSVLLTKGITAKHNSKQNVAVCYEMPNEDVRVLIGNLLLEETLETLTALGLSIQWTDVPLGHTPYDVAAVIDSSPDPAVPNLKKAIDGVCDTVYVALGILAACGVPDKPHLKEVCKANERKFPGGEVTFCGKTGKYLKPRDWKEPDHQKVMEDNLYKTDMKAVTDILVKKFKKKDKK